VGSNLTTFAENAAIGRLAHVKWQSSNGGS
jgi:hypothetical protein